MYEALNLKVLHNEDIQHYFTVEKL